jgi:hypothetical protein
LASDPVLDLFFFLAPPLNSNNTEEESYFWLLWLLNRNKSSFLISVVLVAVVRREDTVFGPKPNIGVVVVEEDAPSQEIDKTLIINMMAPPPQTI